MLEKPEKDRPDINIVDDKLNNRVIPKPKRKLKHFNNVVDPYIQLHIPRVKKNECSCDSGETCSCKLPRLTIMISILFLTRLIFELTAAILGKITVCIFV